MKWLHGNPVVPHPVMHHLQDFIAGHVSHHARSMQKAVAPVASVLGPSENMRVFVSHAPIKIHGCLESALSVLGPALIHMANVHAAVFIVKGHGGLGFGNSSHCGGSPVVIVSLSHRNRNCRRNTNSFQILFETNSIFFIFIVYRNYILIDSIAGTLRRYPSHSSLCTAFRIRWNECSVRIRLL